MQPKQIRILVTGSRDWTDWRAVREMLMCEVRGYYPSEVTIVHGDCPRGADRIAHGIAKDMRWNIEPHPANWLNGKGAGFRRNSRMVDFGADVCLAFLMRCTKPRCADRPLHYSHGTVDCMTKAEAAGIPVKRVRR